METKMKPLVGHVTMLDCQRKATSLPRKVVYHFLNLAKSPPYGIGTWHNGGTFLSKGEQMMKLSSLDHLKSARDISNFWVIIS